MYEHSEKFNKELENIKSRLRVEEYNWKKKYTRLESTD